MVFDAPIPGQSLTKEPRNHPWERPPETSDPDQAIVHHLTRVSQPRVMNKILDGVEAGMPVSLITDLMLTGAVSQGIHDIDMSMIVAPIVHDYIVNLLEEEGIEFKEFFEDNSDEEAKHEMALAKAVKNVSTDAMGTRELLEEKLKETEPQEEVFEEEEPAPRGLMSRGDM